MQPIAGFAFDTFFLIQLFIIKYLRTIQAIENITYLTDLQAFI